MALGRTNIITNDGGLGGGVTTVDLPTRLNALSSNAGNTLATLTLSYSDATYVTGVQVNYKTGSYPTSPTDGQSMTVTGAPTSITATGLTNTLTYYFRVFLYREIDGVKYYQTDITNAKTSCIPRTVEIVGITPLVSAADHLVIVNSGNFTLSAPAGTKVIIGSAGSGVTGGYVAEYTLPSDIVDENCTATISSSKAENASNLKIGSTYYGCGKTEQIIQSKWGPIGGKGGYSANSSSDYGGAGAGTGAGGGGGSATYGGAGGKGGNNGGYGNYGGNGVSGGNGKDGASGKGGGGAGHAGGGGGGGYAAGGGAGGAFYYADGDDAYADDGSPGTGIIVFQWDM